VHLPLVRYEQQAGIGLAVRKYVMMRRGILSSDTQRKPAAILSSSAKEEVEYLLSRIARVDKRAALAPHGAFKNTELPVSASREAQKAK
jgi:4-hydroxy-tetrahydrodipicolinate synthase